MAGELKGGSEKKAEGKDAGVHNALLETGGHTTGGSA